ncbi:MAG: PilZ domain-containing protein, partial [Acidobacteriota bacterium]
FQDRLRSRDYIANEQDMFYHVVQPGRDAFNSSFYCGSGALFRREALKEIGGFPESTVTEDLHTSVLLHSRGWKSVYLNRDLSAGLAPESFQAYVTQRRRWARGTLQVMLAQRGLFLRGLTIMQRINYLATLWYWFYGLPRLIYLIAPLFFLLAGIKPLVVHHLTDLLTYYLPHLAISIVGFQLVNLGMRRIFWSDIYESCIALHVALTTLFFAFSPKRVHFTVTPKGQAAQAPAPWRLALPGLGVAVLVASGAVIGLSRMAGKDGSEGGLAINTLWDLYNLVVLSFGLLLFRPSPRRRRSIRLARSLPLVLGWKNHAVEGELVDLSETGLSFRLQKAVPLPDYLDVNLGGSVSEGLSLRSRLVRCDVDPSGHMSAAVDFIHRSEHQHQRLVELMFSAPDSWSGPLTLAMGAPEHFTRIIRSLLSIFSREERLRRMAPRFHARLTAQIQAENGDLEPVTITDISIRGAALRLGKSQSIPSPEQFKLTLIWNRLERSSLPCRIRNVRSAPSGGRILGVLFADPTPAEMADLRKQLYGEKVVPIRRGLAS